MELAAEPRTELRKATGALRDRGFIPAVCYGRGIENVHLSVPVKDFTRVFREAGETTVVQLRVANETYPALIHDVQRDSITGEVRHVDFYHIQKGQKVRAHVPLVFTGEAPGVKEKGGVLNKPILEIEVEAEAEHLPHELTVDLSALTDIDTSIHVQDIVVPRGVTLHVDPETVVASVAPPRKEEEVAPPPAEEGADVAAVKVEGEEEQAERDAEKGEQNVKEGAGGGDRSGEKSK